MEYLFTERAHLMCPNMAFGIALQVDRPFDEARIRETADVLAEAHPFLKALLGYDPETDKYYYQITERSRTAVMIQEPEITGLEAPEIMDVFDQMNRHDFDLKSEGMLRILSWRSGEKTVFLLLFHHLLADGRGALSLAEELAEYYVFGKKPAFTEEKLISSKADLPKDSGLPWISKMLVNRANKRWNKEKVKLEYTDYIHFADRFLENYPIRHDLATVEKEDLAKIVEACHANDVTVNDYLLAKKFIEESTDKIIIANDLREDLACYRQGALGNYSTAFSVELRKKAGDLFGVAKQVHAAIQKIMKDPKKRCLVLQCYADLEPGVLDASFFAAKGIFQSDAAKFIGTMFFGFGAAGGHSITNLGRMESAAMEDAFFIPPASPAMKKTLGVLTVNGRMRICTSERM